MIINRLKYLAVCLLVLLNVVSTMGSNGGYKFFNSAISPSLCLSFKSNRMTDVCCKNDVSQQIYVHMTGVSTGIFHIKNFKKVLCYDKLKMRFRLLKRRNLGLEQCRHQRRRLREHRRRGRMYTGCSLTEANIEHLKQKGCEMHENVDGAGYAYISFEEAELYLGLRANGRVQKHKRGKTMREPTTMGRRFMIRSRKSFRNYSNNDAC